MNAQYPRQAPTPAPPQAPGKLQGGLTFKDVINESPEFYNGLSDVEKRQMALNFFDDELGSGEAFAKSSPEQQLKTKADFLASYGLLPNQPGAMVRAGDFVDDVTRGFGQPYTFGLQDLADQGLSALFGGNNFNGQALPSGPTSPSVAGVRGYNDLIMEGTDPRSLIGRGVPGFVGSVAGMFSNAAELIPQASQQILGNLPRGMQFLGGQLPKTLSDALARTGVATAQQAGLGLSNVAQNKQTPLGALADTAITAGLAPFQFANRFADAGFQGAAGYAGEAGSSILNDITEGSRIDLGKANERGLIGGALGLGFGFGANQPSHSSTRPVGLTGVQRANAAPLAPPRAGMPVRVQGQGTVAGAAPSPVPPMSPLALQGKVTKQGRTALDVEAANKQAALGSTGFSTGSDIPQRYGVPEVDPRLADTVEDAKVIAEELAQMAADFHLSGETKNATAIRKTMGENMRNHPNPEIREVYRRALIEYKRKITAQNKAARGEAADSSSDVSKLGYNPNPEGTGRKLDTTKRPTQPAQDKAPEQYNPYNYDEPDARQDTTTDTASKPKADDKPAKSSKPKEEQTKGKQPPKRVKVESIVKKADNALYDAYEGAFEGTAYKSVDDINADRATKDALGTETNPPDDIKAPDSPQALQRRFMEIVKEVESKSDPYGIQGLKNYKQKLTQIKNMAAGKIKVNGTTLSGGKQGTEFANAQQVYRELVWRKQNMPQVKEIEANLKAAREQNANLFELAEAQELNFQTGKGKQAEIPDGWVDFDAVKDKFPNKNLYNRAKAAWEASLEGKQVRIKYHAKHGHTSTIGKVGPDKFEGVKDVTVLGFQEGRPGEVYMKALNPDGHLTTYKFSDTQAEGTVLKQPEKLDLDSKVGVWPNVHEGPKQFEIADVLGKDIRPEIQSIDDLSTKARKALEMYRKIESGEPFGINDPDKLRRMVDDLSPEESRFVFKELDKRKHGDTEYEGKGC